MTTRKRGAPFGNTNACKHGLYARLLHERAIQEAAEAPYIGLQPELDLVKSLSQRIHAENLFPHSRFPEEAENTFLILLLARAARFALQPSSRYLDLTHLLEMAFAHLINEFDLEPNPDDLPNGN